MSACVSYLRPQKFNSKWVLRGNVVSCVKCEGGGTHTTRGNSAKGYFVSILCRVSLVPLFSGAQSGANILQMPTVLGNINIQTIHGLSNLCGDQKQCCWDKKKK